MRTFLSVAVLFGVFAALVALIAKNAMIHILHPL